MKHKVALIGFGTVGQGLAEILQARATALEVNSGVTFVVVAVSDLLKGSVYAFDQGALVIALK